MSNNAAIDLWQMAAECLRIVCLRLCLYKKMHINITFVCDLLWPRRWPDPVILSASEISSFVLFYAGLKRTLRLKSADRLAKILRLSSCFVGNFKCHVCGYVVFIPIQMPLLIPFCIHQQAF